MDLYEKIEKTRFIGREFIVWIWWKSELTEGKMELGDFGPSEVWLDDQLTLESRGENVEQSKLKGSSPSTSPEAYEALRQGKVPTKARLSITLEEREFSCVIDGETFALSGVRIPTLLQDEKEERFYERMYLLEELEDMLAALFREFLIIRVSPKWKGLASEIRAWVRGEPEMTAEDYHGLISKLLKNQPKPAKAAPPVEASPEPPEEAEPNAPKPVEPTQDESPQPPPEDVAEPISAQPAPA